MNIFTTGYELITTITNLLIFITSLYCLLHIKNEKWKLFYLLMSIDSFLGAIAHGFILNSTLYNLIWITLSIAFVITVNTLLNIFMNNTIKHSIELSIIVSISLLTTYFLGLNFILIFSLYVLSILLINIYFIIKKKLNKYFLYGLIAELIGGLFLIFKIDLSIIDHNGIYHLFVIINLILFYIGINKK